MYLRELQKKKKKQKCLIKHIPMKKKLAIISILIFISSCDKKSTLQSFLSKKTERFSLQADTTYKTNSTEIKNIERTFYKREHTKYDPYITISNIVGTNKYTITAMEYDGDKFIASAFHEFTKKNSLERVLNAIDTINKYPNKKLRFVVENTVIYPNYGGGGLGLLDRDNYSGFGFSKGQQTDSLHYAYKRYKKELLNN